MIQKTQSFQTTDGEIFRHEIEKVLEEASLPAQAKLSEIAGTIVGQKEKVLDILTTGPRSKPKARKINKKKGGENESQSKI